MGKEVGDCIATQLRAGAVSAMGTRSGVNRSIRWWICRTGNPRAIVYIQDALIPKNH
jgi:hypothetical protein